MITTQEILDTVAPETPDPDIVELLIQRATATVGREVGYYLGPPKAVAEFYRGGVLEFYLENPPAAGAIVLAGSNGVQDPYTDFATSVYVVEGRRVKIAPGYVRADYRVTYSVGYDPEGNPPPPQELAAIVRQMVLRTLESGGQIARGSASDLQSETIGDYSYTRGDVSAAAAALGEDWTTFVKRWRRMRGP